MLPLPVHCRRGDSSHITYCSPKVFSREWRQARRLFGNEAFVLSLEGVRDVLLAASLQVVEALLMSDSVNLTLDLVWLGGEASVDVH